MTNKLKQEAREECPFCDIEKIKSNVTDHGDVISFEPLNPVTEGHLLVVPKRHVSDFTEDCDVSGGVMRVASLIAGMNGGDCNIITSKGKSATQSVPHLHVHIVPRKKDDGLLLPWSDTTALIDKALEARDKEIEEVIEEGFTEAIVRSSSTTLKDKKTV